MTEHIAVCRDCDDRESFDTLRGLRDSEWEDVSVYGVTVGNDVQEHAAQCADHSDGQSDVESAIDKLTPSTGGDEDDDDDESGRVTYGGRHPMDRRAGSSDDSPTPTPFLDHMEQREQYVSQAAVQAIRDMADEVEKQMKAEGVAQLMNARWDDG